MTQELKEEMIIIKRREKRTTEDGVKSEKGSGPSARRTFSRKARIAFKESQTASLCWA